MNFCIMYIARISNVSNDFQYIFVSKHQITQDDVITYLNSKDESLDLEVNRLGLYSNLLNKFITYKVNTIEEI